MTSENEHSAGQKELVSWLWKLQLIAAALLLWALAEVNPYGYYTFLRWSCCAIFVVSALFFYQANEVGWSVGMVGLAILFNPIAPIHLNREIWRFLDIGAAGIACAVAWRVRRMTRERTWDNCKRVSHKVEGPRIG